MGIRFILSIVYTMLLFLLCVSYVNRVDMYGYANVDVKPFIAWVFIDSLFLFGAIQVSFKKR
jgi:hypothetical protein